LQQLARASAAAAREHAAAQVNKLTAENQGLREQLEAANMRAQSAGLITNPKVRNNRRGESVLPFGLVEA
jgi:hypothetical protein